MTMNNINQHHNNSSSNNMGDTMLTKVFVGGLAWETPTEAMREHFGKYGELVEAVIISDKLTGRSKGYGFVTFKDSESAKKACEDANHIINGRRANCNLASLGARRSRHSPPIAPTPPPQQGPNVVGPRANSASPSSHVQWYYPAGAPQAATPASLFHHQQHHQPLPFYGYSPAYVATDLNYNHKLSYSGGAYMNGHFSQVYPSQPMMSGNTLIPIYPYYHFHQQSQTMGLPAHMYSATAAGPMAAVPALMSKPTSVSPAAGTIVIKRVMTKSN